MLNTYCTTILHPIRKHLGISDSEWCFLDTIFKLQANPKGKFPGWCDAKKEDLANDRSLSRQGLSKMIDKLEGLDLIEKSPKSHLRTTEKWYFETVTKKNETMALSEDVNFVDNSKRVLNVNLVDTECKLSLREDVNLVDTECKLSLQSKENKNKIRIENKNENAEIFQISGHAPENQFFKKANGTFAVEAGKENGAKAPPVPPPPPAAPRPETQLEKGFRENFEAIGARFVDVSPAEAKAEKKFSKPRPDKGPLPHPATVAAFAKFDDPAAIEAAWCRWLKYKAQQFGTVKGRYKSEDSELEALRKIYKEFGRDTARISRAVAYSIGKVWNGVFEEKEETVFQKPQYQKPAPMDTVLDPYKNFGVSR